MAPPGVGLPVMLIRREARGQASRTGARRHPVTSVYAQALGNLGVSAVLLRDSQKSRGDFPMARCSAFVASVAVALLLCAAPAFAITTAQEAYAPSGGSEQAAVQSGVSGGKAPSPNSSSSAAASTAASSSRPAPNGALPFTGLDVAML